ncbi:MAG TPA: hypothetical protein VEC93_02705 [Anaerolineae bacterium]|nr:hypothetical protein [Anaerolineae bacterium]
MRRTILITLMTVLSGFIIGFACSVMGTMGYVAAQGQPTATPSPTATFPPSATATPRPTKTPAPPTSANGSDPEAEYYRAIFDVCMYSAGKANVPPEKAIEGCRLFTRQTMQQEWFSEPSREWEWPLPATQLQAGPSA